MRNIIGIGETVLDIIFRRDQPQRAVPGGSTFNALISLGRMLGTRTRGSASTERSDQDFGTVKMITETGDDHIGHIITSFMEQNHVSTDLVTINPGTQSHLSLAFLDEESNAQYEFYKDHAAAKLNTGFASHNTLNGKEDNRALSDVNFTSSDIILFGSFFAINPVLRSQTRFLFKAAHDAGAILYYDINFRRSHIKDIPATLGNLEENMRLATVVRGSAEDFGYLYGTTDPKEVYERYIRQHCPFFICTDGSRPTQIFLSAADGETRMFQVDVPEVGHVVSTIGAGDNFNAGFVYGIVQRGFERKDFADAVSLGSSHQSFIALIQQAQRFSAHVCGRMDNYVDVSFRP